MREETSDGFLCGIVDGVSLVCGVVDGVPFVDRLGEKAEPLVADRDGRKSNCTSLESSGELLCHDDVDQRTGITSREPPVPESLGKLRWE